MAVTVPGEDTFDVAPNDPLILIDVEGNRYHIRAAEDGGIVITSPDYPLQILPAAMNKIAILQVKPAR